MSDGGLLRRGERIILPSTLIPIAIEKAHQGGHPGESSMKRRLRTYFWFPGLDMAVKNKIKLCTSCQLYTQKTTKEPQSMIVPPSTAWEKVSLDLFGPTPTGKRVLVAQDVLSRYPAAQFVTDTKAKSVMPALDNIYRHYGYPSTHLTDNGPPFDSFAFTQYTQKKGIRHETIYPYHPQANPAERVMKPLGKALKVAHSIQQQPREALNNFLVGYRSTPHIATGVSPGNYLFRDGYRADFPNRKVLRDQDIIKAKEDDTRYRSAIN